MRPYMPTRPRSGRDQTTSASGTGTATGLVGVDAPRHPEKPGDVHAIERQVEADEEEPEVQPAERLAAHTSRKFREPVIEGGEYREEDCAHDDVVKVRD